MTESQNKEMQELDDWLAENVMGKPTGYYSLQMSNVDSDRWKDWHPTTNIAQAFEVVEKMNDCLHLKEHGEEGKWCAMFCASMMEYEHGEIPALAICLAAKKAKEGS